jgi:hypothetical protein
VKRRHPKAPEIVPKQSVDANHYNTGDNARGNAIFAIVTMAYTRKQIVTCISILVRKPKRPTIAMY